MLTSNRTYPFSVPINSTGADSYPYVDGSEASNPLADSDASDDSSYYDDPSNESPQTGKKKPSMLSTILGAAAKGFQAGMPQQQAPYGGQRKNNLISHNMPSQYPQQPQPQQNPLMNSFYQLGTSLGQRLRGGYDNGN